MVVAVVMVVAVSVAVAVAVVVVVAVLVVAVVRSFACIANLKSSRSIGLGSQIGV